jgi:tetratricopeptide (TPR) repeat protein
MQGRPAGVILAVLGFWVASTWAPVAADQQDQRLEGMFDRLQTTADRAEAGAVQQQIWAIWIESDDTRVQLWMRQGVSAMGLRRLDLALARFDRMVDYAPGFAEGWNKRATVHYMMGNYRASVLDIQKTLDLEPRHFGAWSGLGLIYDAIGQPAAALRSYEAALAVNPHLDGIDRRVEELRRELAGRRT